MPESLTGPADDAAVPAFWAALGLPGLVDVHTHFMPRRVMDKVWAYFDAVGPLLGRPWPITYREDEADRVARLRALGVRAFTAMLYPHKPGMAPFLNAWAVDFAAATPDVLHTATFFPEPGAAEYVADALAAGARVFKSHVQVGDYDPRDPLLDGVWGALAEAGVPVVVHCGSGPAPGRFTGPEIFGEVLARHPRLPAVVAHMGMPEYDSFLALARRYPEVRLDTTMAFTDFVAGDMACPPHLLAEVRALGLDGRVLLGTDFPNIPYPYAHQLEALARLGLGEEWLRQVLWHAGAELFGVAGSDAASQA